MTRNETIADQYYTQRRTQAAIAREHGLTRERVRQIVNQYDHPNRAHIIANTAQRKYWTTDAGIAMLKSLRANGLSYAQIAEQTGAGTRQWVHKILQDHEVDQGAT